MPSPEVIVVDVGNTSLKLVTFDAKGAVLHAQRIPAALATSPPPGAAEGTPVLAVSVSDRGIREFEGRGPGEWPRRVLLLGREFPLRARDRTATPGTTGHDRLCAAAAAHARAGGAAVVVGAGTALTVDAVGADGAFLGGAIAPGLAAAAAGLAEAAPRLPRPDLAAGPIEFPGSSTAAALRSGHLLAAAGAVLVLAGAARRAAAGPSGDPSAVPVLVHGGDADAVASALGSLPQAPEVVRAPWLVAEGARLAWIRAGRPT